jgi:hypothetical protein
MYTIISANLADIMADILRMRELNLRIPCGDYRERVRQNRYLHRTLHGSISGGAGQGDAGEAGRDIHDPAFIADERQQFLGEKEHAFEMDVDPRLWAVLRPRPRLAPVIWAVFVVDLLEFSLGTAVLRKALWRGILGAGPPRLNAGNRE